ncbi:hypothetical protein [Acetobacter sp.]|uniref:hypothetical protein n=1 Tax=Acetobacter sp. TaxID=440 RepID=UPI0039EA7C4A
MSELRNRGLRALACLTSVMLLSGCARYEAGRRDACSKEEPELSLLREPTLANFSRDCGLQYYPDATGLVTLHYQPPRGNGTIPVSAPRAFAVSEAVGAHGRVWYLCLPVPALLQPGSPKVSSVEAVCRYAGSGPDRLSLTYDQADAAAHDPRGW